MDRQEITNSKKDEERSIHKKSYGTVTWDAKGILLADYLQKGRTSNDEYSEAVETKTQGEKPDAAKKNNLSHQDNAPKHNTVTVMVKIHKLKFENVPHIPYLASADFSLPIPQKISF